MMKRNEFIEKAQKIHGDKYDYSKVEYTNNKAKVCIICPEHGEFWQIAQGHLKGQGCPKCGLKKQTLKRTKKNENFIKEARYIHNGNYDYSKVEYKNAHTKVCIICPEHGEFWQSPHEHLKGQGCPNCKKKTISKIKSDTRESFIEKSQKIHGDKYDYSKVDYIKSKEKVCIICPEHGEFWQTPHEHIQGCGCLKCSKNTSIGEKNIGDFIASLNFFVTRQNKNIIPNREIDIYMPSNRVAIEYDGLYWHSSKKIDKNYHLIKTELCEKQGIRLIHIFEDEWLEHEDIVKSKLKSILGLTEKKVFARKCIIKEVPFNEAKTFLEKNHLQGNVNAKYNYGLYYKDELVSIMTFGSKRKSLGSKSEKGVYEMLRFCNKLDTTVVGGASKLLKHFIKVHKPKQIISYCDRRWSQGNMYEKLGFKFDHYSKPNYFYIVNGKRENRFKYRKSELVRQGFDKNKSEHEIMLERGIYRIYDCGTKVYSLAIGDL